MIRVLRCDDCPYSGRYIGDTGFDRAQRHAEEFATARGCYQTRARVKRALFMTIVPKKATPEVTNEDWYYLEFLRGGTHFGRLEQDGKVHARCGEEFSPQADLFGGGGPAVAMLPMPAGQACRKCCAQRGLLSAEGVPIQEVESPPPNSVRRDLRPLGTWVRRTPGAALPSPPATAPIAPPMAPPTEPPVVTSSAGSWSRKSAKPGDTHWVITQHNRGMKIAACGVSFRGKTVNNPTPDRLCPACEAQRDPR
jgi:hypothetical protein